jgi:hypothetical protein
MPWQTHRPAGFRHIKRYSSRRRGAAVHGNTGETFLGLVFTDPRLSSAIHAADNGFRRNRLAGIL